MKTNLLILNFILMPILLYSQPNKNLVWSFRPASSNSCIISDFHDIQFYDDSTFEYNSPLELRYGKGKYEMKDSVITCHYEGSETEFELKKGWIEIEEDSLITNNYKIKVKDGITNEDLIAATIEFYNGTNKINEDVTRTDWEGEYTITESGFNKIIISYYGYKTLTAIIPSKLNNSLIFYLGSDNKKRMIAKNVIEKYKILTIKGTSITLLRMNACRRIYSEE